MPPAEENIPAVTHGTPFAQDSRVVSEKRLVKPCKGGADKNGRCFCKNIPTDNLADGLHFLDRLCPTSV